MMTPLSQYDWLYCLMRVMKRGIRLSDVDDSEPKALYPALGDVVKVSDNTAKMKGKKDTFVRIFHGLKTLEYDLALHADNRTAMLKALRELHPKIADTVEAAINVAADE